MTKESRLLFGLEDIRSIRFECKECHAVISCAPKNWEHLQFIACTNCRKSLVRDKYDEDAVIQFVKSTQRLMERVETFTCEIRLEFDSVQGELAIPK